MLHALSRISASRLTYFIVAHRHLSVALVNSYSLLQRLTVQHSVLLLNFKFHTKEIKSKNQEKPIYLLLVATEKEACVSKIKSPPNIYISLIQFLFFFFSSPGNNFPRVLESKSRAEIINADQTRMALCFENKPYG